LVKALKDGWLLSDVSDDSEEDSEEDSDRYE
jgi:hypothetical protein